MQYQSQALSHRHTALYHHPSNVKSINSDCSFQYVQLGRAKI
ncbi:hypothetical protein S7335_3733 [Synechococcus sp. PCC 7335]|nr:hypothetical protein S7335_3733 [Synechococcus sp. PCC 7335]